MTIATTSPVRDNEPMDPDHPRAGGPRRRRTFTTQDKLAHVTAYEQACQSEQGGAYLRREGLYSSQVSDWRTQRDAGVLDPAKPKGTKIGKLTAEQAQIARLTRELDAANQRLETTETALQIMGKAHALLEQISKRADTDDTRKRR